jgi:predicted Zn-dependent protease
MLKRAIRISKGWTLALFLVLGVGMYSGSWADDDPLDTVSEIPRKARLALFKAQEKQRGGDVQAASTILGEFLEKHPGEDHYLVRYHVAGHLVQLDRSNEALAHYEACVQLEPRFAEGWLGLGQTAYSVGQYTRAAEALQRGYARSSDEKPDLLYYAAASHILAENPGRAAPLLEDLVSGDLGTPKIEWYRALLSCCMDIDDIPRGRDAISGLVKDFGKDPEAWILAYQFNAGTRDYRQAAVALTVVGYLRPLSREEEVQLGNLYSAIGIPAIATEHLENAYRENASAQDLEQLASAYLAAHEREAALQTLHRALEKKPTSRLWSLLGDLHYMERDYPKAFEAYQQCANLDPEQGRAYLMMGYCAIEMGDIGEAMVQLKSAARFADHERTASQLMQRVQRMKS